MAAQELRATLLVTALLTPLTALAQGGPPADIGGVHYAAVDPGEPFTEASMAKVDWAAPQPTERERSAGMIAHVTADPGDYKPNRPPRPEERVSRLSTLVTPGASVAVWFGVYALADLEGLEVRVDPRGAPLSVDVRHEHFWPQRTGWRSRQWYMTPEVLLPCSAGVRTVPTQRGLLEERPFNVAQGETAAFWLTLTAPPTARPGAYRAAVRVVARGREMELLLPLSVEVLPFALERPTDRLSLLYADVARWRTMSDEQVLAELRDFARHGFTGLVEMPLGEPDLSQLAAGKVTFDASAFTRLAALCAQAGLPGPHVCSAGGLPQRVAEALGIECNLHEDTWPEELKAGLRTVVRAAVEATKDIPQRWYYYGVDEPSGENTYAIQDYQCWRRGGAETYATFYNIGFLERASEYLTAPCFVVGLVSAKDTATEAREACARTGAEFWWYGSGSYVNPYPQECFMFHNRYAAGLLWYKTGARAQVTWTFCRPHEDVFNDFDGSAVNAGEPKDQVTAYPHLLKPDDWSTYQGAIPTIAWESIREGVDDYAYLYTLERAIDRAKQSSSAPKQRAAMRAEEALRAMVDGIPWSNPMNAATFSTQRLQDVRQKAARLIAELEG